MKRSLGGLSATLLGLSAVAVVLSPAAAADDPLCAGTKCAFVSPNQKIGCVITVGAGGGVPDAVFCAWGDGERAHTVSMLPNGALTPCINPAVDISKACPYTVLTGAKVLGSKHRVQVIQQTAQQNLVDCAIARPQTPDLVTKEILQIGTPTGVATAGLGTQVQKFGRTTGYTQGQIIQVDVTVTVNYNGPIAVFTDQLMAGAMSQGGDSGSLVLDTQKRAVGLLFAGSDTSTIINPIQFVLDALHVEIVT